MTGASIHLEVTWHLFAAIAEEMGTLLRRSACSPNIKERRDFSCALFDEQMRLVAQAAHIPVHLGAMPLSVQAAVERFGGDLAPGDLVMLNDPFHGGTHLPDITMVSPVFLGQERIGFAACRAHHADVGGMTPGSMPVAREIYQEGLILPPVKLLHAGRIDEGILDVLLANVRTPQERRGDLNAQIAANRRGAERLLELFQRLGRQESRAAMQALMAYTERMTRAVLRAIPDGTYTFEDALDDDGIRPERVPIRAVITIRADEAVVDLSGSAAQQQGGINAVLAITISAVQYVIRCLVGGEVPDNAGCMLPVQVIAPPGTVVNALPPAAVAGGNVETSQRIVDVLLGALAQACPERIPAASQGTMNNVSIGGGLPGGMGDGESRFAYYETIGGGAGAGAHAAGASAIHTHMTNTLNTPVEALEYAYPLRVLCSAIRQGSGGGGRFSGGDGIRRDLQALVDCQATLLTERRSSRPYGLAGGEGGQPGENVLIREGSEQPLPSKGTLELKAGDVLSIRTPGGGGYGSKKA